jgi:hypothetical protein
MGSVRRRGWPGSGTTLLPENGKSFDYGFVYDPEWVRGCDQCGLPAFSLDNLIVFGSNTAHSF